MSTHTAPATLLDQLADEQIAYELIPHRRTETAIAEADALGVEPRQVAKTIVLTTPAGPVRAVVPASERLDLRKVRDFLDTTHVELVTEEVLADAFPEFELGAVPPIPGETHDRVLVDVRLCENEFVLVEAGTHEQSLRLRTADLIGLDRALLADICRD
jgi:Ala-tRNA(Pro) deacylase